MAGYVSARGGHPTGTRSVLGTCSVSPAQGALGREVWQAVLRRLLNYRRHRNAQYMDTRRTGAGPQDFGIKTDTHPPQIRNQFT